MNLIDREGGNAMTILDEVQAYLNKYVVLPNQEEQSLILATWVLHTWAFEDIARTTPYIYVTSAEKQSGKSTLIEVCESLVREPMKALDMTGPVLFRAINQNQPTILLDETDAIWSGAKNEGLRGAINGGYKIGGSVWRLDKGTPVQFGTFCPKLLAGIHNGKLPDTILDRSIPLILKRKRPGQDAAPFVPTSSVVIDTTERIWDGIDEWLADNVGQLQGTEVQFVDGLSDRTCEILWPLLDIANIFGRGEELINAVTNTMKVYNETMVEEDVTRNTLQMIADTFDCERRSAIHTETIVETLELRDGKALAEILAPYNIESMNVRMGNSVRKGYKINQFWDAWDAYGIKPENFQRTV